MGGGGLASEVLLLRKKGWGREKCYHPEGAGGHNKFWRILNTGA